MKFPRHSRQIGWAGLILLIVAIWPHSAHALQFPQDAYNLFGNLILFVLQSVAQLVAMVTHFLIIIAQYSDFTRNAIVTIGWNLVVDIANMIFIIALLIIAVGTVLRIQNYRYNRLLGNVILMAFLVNFSKTIAAFFIQATQIVMLTFVDAFRDAAFGNFATMFGLEKVLTFSQTAQPDGTLDILASLLIGLFFLTVALVTILALAVVLSVRVVMLWILVILSPFAYALRIIPDTERWARQWWSEFGKWVTTGPVIAFFLWLALSILSQAGNQNTGNQTSSWITSDPSVSQAINAIPPEETNVYFKGTQLLEIDNFVSFIVAIVFLWMGLNMATSTGGIAGRWAGKIATGGLAAYGVVSGLNALRDRTVAPIQGYLKQRQQRSQQGVAERTAGLSARIDQGLSATVGQLGRARTAATTGLGAAARNLGTLGTKEGREKYGERVAAATIAGGTIGTREYRQAQGRIQAFKQGQVEQRGREIDFAKLPPELQAALAGGGPAAQRVNAILAMAAQNTLNHENSQHLAGARDAMKYLGDGKAGRDFIQTLGKQQSVFTRHMLFDGDVDQWINSDRYKSLLRQRVVGTDLLTEDDRMGLDSEMNKKANVAAAREFSNFLESIAKTRDEMERFKKGLGENADGVLQHVDMEGKSFDEKRLVAEAWGQMGAAFKKKEKDAEGNNTFDEDSLIRFATLKGGKYADYIASTAMKKENAPMIGALIAASKLNEKELTTIAEKSEVYRKNLGEALGDDTSGALKDVYRRNAEKKKAEGKPVVSTGGINGKTYNPTDDMFYHQNLVRRAKLKVTRSKENLYETDVDAGVDGAEEAMGHAVKTLGPMDLLFAPQGAWAKSTSFGPKFRYAMARRMGIKSLGDMYAMGGQQAAMVRQALQEFEKTVEAATKGKSKQEIEKLAIWKRLTALKRNESTSDIF